MCDISVDAEIKLWLDDVPKEKWDDIAERINEFSNIYDYKYDADNGYIYFITYISVDSYKTSYERYSYDGWDSIKGEYREYGNCIVILIDDLKMDTPEKDILKIDEDIIIEMDYDKEYVETRIKEYEEVE